MWRYRWLEHQFRNQFCNQAQRRTSNLPEKATRLRLSWVRLGLMGWAGLLGLCGQSARAIDRATLDLLTTPLEPALFQPGALVLDPTIVTPDRISQTELTPPSLWWTEDQFSDQLLSYWLAYPGTATSPRRVDLIVDQQAWNASDYLRRYVFVNQFGTTAKEFGYSTRVFNPQGELLGAHICQFEPDRSNLEAACSIFLNASGRSAFRGGSVNPFANPSGASSPTDGGTLPSP
jgi:hypothetical protein